MDINYKKQAMNPYLPCHEYIPDAEPHIFGGRVYIFGSHDKFNGFIFCLNDYVCWSAPVNDLSDWRYEGIIYKKRQDPKNKSGLHCMFAPDVTQGPDGRYYLFYTLGFYGIMGVAVCNEPAGIYEFYGHVKFEDGHIWGTRSGEPLPFDPAVFIDDDEKIYLYSGFAVKTPAITSRMKNLRNPGCVVFELKKDMLTIIKGPNLLLPRKNNNSLNNFSGHEFFEASSMRKINGKYYLIYSSWRNHELCYAVSGKPNEGFSYGGILISIGDLNADNCADEKKAKNYLGNTHGSIIKIKDQWYIFYHRQTNRHSFSRQACAQPLVMSDDGRFFQSEITSCGLNNAPLRGKGEYSAFIACNLWSKDGARRVDKLFSKFRLRKHPYLTQTGKDGDDKAVQYIANMRDGAAAGFKYFDINDTSHIRITVSGRCKGDIHVSVTEDFSVIACRLPVFLINAVKNIESCLNINPGRRALFFKFIGKGYMNFFSFELS